MEPKSGEFAAIYFFCFWLAIANFMVCFGFSAISGIIFSLKSAVPILTVTGFGAWMAEWNSGVTS